MSILLVWLAGYVKVLDSLAVQYSIAGLLRHSVQDTQNPSYFINTMPESPYDTSTIPMWQALAIVFVMMPTSLHNYLSTANTMNFLLDCVTPQITTHFPAPIITPLQCVLTHMVLVGVRCRAEHRIRRVANHACTHQLCRRLSSIMSASSSTSLHAMRRT